MAAVARFSTAMFAIICIFCEVRPCLAGAGLRGQGGKTAGLAEAERQSLVALAGRFTHTNGSSRLQMYEDAFEMMFKALPKDEHGGLQHNVVRYALHRIFVKRHSWYVRGLDAEGDKAAIAMRKEPDKRLTFDLNSVPVLPSLLQSSMESKHADVGLSLRELAALAASIEDLAHKESLYRLKLAFEATQVPNDSELQEETVARIVQTYFTIFLLGNDFDDWSFRTVRERNDEFMRSNRWTEFAPWVTNMTDRVLQELRTYKADATTGFAEVARITETISDNFGEFNDRECSAMKHELLTMEGKIPGRVRLSDFYNRSLSKIGVWWFGERIDYLRTLGVLDESNVSNPLVIVPNYVTASPQCLRASTVYDVCCPSECEQVIAAVEEAAGAPETSVETIAKTVARLETDTTEQRERLSDSLMDRLRSLAEENGGQVQITSRKFALWLHHAFPRECPFPHQEGAATPLTPDEWMKSTGQTTQLATEEEMVEHIREDDTCSAGGELELPWIDYDTPTAERLLQATLSEAPMIEEAAGFPNVVFLLAVCGAVLLRMRQSNEKAQKLKLRATAAMHGSCA
eukprot:TRINITY_DN21462_c0_g1_i2.p1 TRINITY_DN21462_c0_g1~~TRINITY_DN21462_c0_g1_i2.p1  ORF type:complete len:574 (-),score=87.58 TRINITY_DN21462_c0_g1_i2:56-1777(-)